MLPTRATAGLPPRAQEPLGPSKKGMVTGFGFAMARRSFRFEALGREVPRVRLAHHYRACKAGILVAAISTKLLTPQIIRCTLSHGIGKSIRRMNARTKSWCLWSSYSSRTMLRSHAPTYVRPTKPRGRCVQPWAEKTFSPGPRQLKNEGFSTFAGAPFAGSHQRRKRHTRCPLCHQHTLRQRRRRQTTLSTGYSGSESVPLGTINGADSAGTGSKASPAVAAAAPPSSNDNIPRRSIVVMGSSRILLA
jgi:hypothetical protein